MKEPATNYGWAGRAWRAGRRLLIAMGAAVVVAGVGSRVNPVAIGPPATEALDPILRRHIDKAEVDVRSLIHAAKSLSQTLGVKVTTPWSSREPLPYEIVPPPAEPLRVQDRPLGWVLGKVLAQFDSATDLVSYSIEGDTIRITLSAETDGSDPILVRAYDVSEHLARYAGRTVTGAYDPADPAALADGRQVAADLLVKTMLDTIAPTRWEVAGGYGGWGIRGWGDFLVVTAPAHVQHQVGRFLFLLRHPAPLGALSTTGTMP